MISFANTVQQYSLWAMLGGGLLAFVSPCVLPMLPVYALYLMGSTDNHAAKPGWGLVLRRCLGLMLSFVLLFMLMGAGAGLLGSALKNADRGVLDIISGVLMVLFGLWMLGIFRWAGLRVPGMAKSTAMEGFWGSLVMGAVLALSWTACLTPVLSSALVLAASTENATMLTGMLQLAVFGLGLCLPMVICMLMYQWLKGAIRWLNKYQLHLRRMGGALMIVYGLFLVVRAVV